MKMYEDRRCNEQSGVMCAVADNLWGIRWWLPVDFCGLDDCGNQPEHCSVSLSSLAMRMNVRHYAWSAMTTIFALRKCWQILESHTLTDSAALRPKISLFFSLIPPVPPFSQFSFSPLFSPHLRLWFVMVTERGARKKNVYFRKKNVSNVS